VRRPALIPYAAAATMLLGIAIACGTKTVATFECELPDAGTDAGPLAQTCPAGQYCLTSGCDAKVGLCEPIAQDECETSNPECGCNGMTYYNACVRQTAGVGRLAPGACDLGTARTCDKPSECEVPNASCAAIVNNTTLMNVVPDLDAGFLPDAGFPFQFPDGGYADQVVRMMAVASCRGFFARFPRLFPQTCWVLPEKPPATGTPRVAGCDQLSFLGPAGVPYTDCIEESSAIRSGGVYFPCFATDAAAE
jgi:hypothetical protein